ncbi:hypothetical protein Sjap_025030 [Stephania japonica]|uniref:Uncharacterized protein n=1 Tax=Stephania japonica TaxID=461633 RepID=A0AAP0E0W2_9MAGN
MSKKIEYRAGKVVMGIEIKGGDAKPKAAPPAPAEKKPDGDKKPPPAEKPAEKPPAEKAEKPAKKEAAEAPKEAAAEMKMLHEPMHTVVAYPIVQPPYGMYYEGYQHEVLPHYNYNYNNGYNARPVYNNNYHGVMNRGYNVHGADYFCEENPACTIM